ncbi:MAG TPA: hypothetical protein VN631_16045 [Negativicutes bacterium]|nr:hypothetical protein [Negativicutes bacterium]
MKEVLDKEVLVVAKTYPNQSTKYVETVCTAGITREGEWIRLYPIKFRYLEGIKQFHTFQWISVKVIRNSNDDRPESYKVIEESITPGKHLDSQKDIAERKALLLPLLRQSMEQIQDDYKKDYYTLAIFKPKDMVGFSISEESDEWSEEELSKLGQMSLFDSPENIPRLLKKVPFSFRCNFRCDDPLCRGEHNIKILSWDFNYAYFTYLQKYGSSAEAIKMLEKKWMSYFASDRNGYLMVGTVHHTHSFNIIGVFSPSKKSPDGYSAPLF